MFVRPTAPRSIGGVLDDAVRLYKESFRAWLWPSVVIALSSAVFGFAFAQLIGPTQSAAQLMNYYKSPAIWICYLVFFIAYTWGHLSLLAAVRGVFTGGNPRAGESFATGLKLVPTGLLAGFLSFFGIFFGFMLLLIPGIILAGRWQFWGISLVDRGGSGTDALGRSSRLVKGHWWRASTIVFVALVMVIALSVLMSFLVALPAFVSSARSVPVQVVIRIIGAAVNTFILPAIPAAAVACYFDLQLRTEGSDLAARVGKLQPA